MITTKLIEVNLTQGTPEWITWRQSGIGGSEVSVIMGSNPFSTIQDLWEQKLGIGKPFVMNDAIQNGIDLEDEARKRFFSATGLKMTPRCFVHPRFDFVRVSLDGISDDYRSILEIKCPMTLAVQRKVLKGILPTYYYPQLQYQLFALSAEIVFYWSYMKSMGGFMLEIYPDKKYQTELLKRTTTFWKYVITKTPPDPKYFQSIT